MSMKHLADIITCVRIAAAVMMIFFEPLSAAFFALYCVGGISDMIDGTVARKCGSSGAFGAKLDSVADLLFFLSAFYKLIPTLFGLFNSYVLWAVCVVAAIKIMSFIVSFVRFRKPLFLHTILNKITGFAVFILPFFYKAGCFIVLIYIVCVIAFLAAAEEFICVLKEKDCNRDIKGILF